MNWDSWIYPFITLVRFGKCSGVILLNPCFLLTFSSMKLWKFDLLALASASVHSSHLPTFFSFRWRMRTRGLLLEYCLLSQSPPPGCRLVTRTAGGENWWPHSQLNGLDILPQSLCYCLFVRVSEKLLYTFCSSFIAVFCGRKGVYLFHFSISISN